MTGFVVLSAARDVGVAYLGLVIGGLLALWFAGRPG